MSSKDAIDQSYIDRITSGITSGISCLKNGHVAEAWDRWLSLMAQANSSEQNELLSTEFLKTFHAEATKLEGSNQWEQAILMRQTIQDLGLEDDTNQREIKRLRLASRKNVHDTSGLFKQLAKLDISFNGKSFPVFYRPSSVGDKGVIRQIFYTGDYEISFCKQGTALWNYYTEKSRDKSALIIDAGANIGASVLYFLVRYPGSTVFSLEPNHHNWMILELNTIDFENKLNFLGGIADIDGEMFLQDPGLQDPSLVDWGFRVRDSGSTPVNVISPKTILSHPFCSDKTYPFIAKIDIEGGEDRLFQGDTDWMTLFPLIIIELHDWMLPFTGNSQNFLRAVAKYNFDFLHRGENIFLFNRSILVQ